MKGTRSQMNLWHVLCICRCVRGAVTCDATSCWSLLSSTSMFSSSCLVSKSCSLFSSLKNKTWRLSVIVRVCDFQRYARKMWCVVPLPEWSYTPHMNAAHTHAQLLTVYTMDVPLGLFPFYSWWINHSMVATYWHHHFNQSALETQKYVKRNHLM